MTAQHLSLEEASDLIGLVYDSAMEPSQWTSLMGRLTELCPGHVSAVVTFDNADWQSSHAATLPEGDHGEQIRKLSDEVTSGESPQPSDLHQVLFRRRPLELGALYATRDIFTEEEFRSFDTYKTTMQPVGAGHWSAIHYAISGERRAAIMVVENDFDDTEKDTARVHAILRLIAPHAVRAALLSRALTMAQHAAETYAGFVDAIALPLLVVDGEGHLQMANKIGQRLLDGASLMRLTSGGRVALPDERDTGALAACIRSAGTEAMPYGLRYVVGERAVTICACPFRVAAAGLASEVDRHLFDKRDLVALFVGVPSSGPVSSRLLRDVFALTQREAEIAAALLGGQSPTEIASETGRSERTIRNQIQSLHEKVGVSSTRALQEALSVFRSVGALLDSGPEGAGLSGTALVNTGPVDIPNLSDGT